MLEKDDIKKLFLILQARYGHKWTTAYDNPEIMIVAVNEWHRELCGFRKEDLRTGLNEWVEDWPPSLPEFCMACMPSLLTLGFNVEEEVKRRLPNYKYIATNNYEEMQRNKEELEIREQVVLECCREARILIREQGIQNLIGEERRLIGELQ